VAALYHISQAQHGMRIIQLYPHSKDRNGLDRRRSRAEAPKLAKRDDMDDEIPF
jgi:hypothetical protein